MSRPIWCTIGSRSRQRRATCASGFANRDPPENEFFSRPRFVPYLVTASETVLGRVQTSLVLSGDKPDCCEGGSTTVMLPKNLETRFLAIKVLNAASSAGVKLTEATVFAEEVVEQTVNTVSTGSAEYAVDFVVTITDKENLQNMCVDTDSTGMGGGNCGPMELVVISNYDPSLKPAHPAAGTTLGWSATFQDPASSTECGNSELSQASNQFGTRLGCYYGTPTSGNYPFDADINHLTPGAYSFRITASGGVDAYSGTGHDFHSRLGRGDDMFLVPEFSLDFGRRLQTSERLRVEVELTIGDPSDGYSGASMEVWASHPVPSPPAPPSTSCTDVFHTVASKSVVGTNTGAPATMYSVQGGFEACCDRCEQSPDCDAFYVDGSDNCHFVGGDVRATAGSDTLYAFNEPNSWSLTRNYGGDCGDERFADMGSYTCDTGPDIRAFSVMPGSPDESKTVSDCASECAKVPRCNGFYFFPYSSQSVELDSGVFDILGCYLFTQDQCTRTELTPKLKSPFLQTCYKECEKSYIPQDHAALPLAGYREHTPGRLGDVFECGEICDDDGECDAYRVNTLSGTCTLYSNQEIEDSVAGHNFNTMTCFKPECCCEREVPFEDCDCFANALCSAITSPSIEKCGQYVNPLGQPCTYDYSSNACVGVELGECANFPPPSPPPPPPPSPPGYFCPEGYTALSSVSELNGYEQMVLPFGHPHTHTVPAPCALHESSSHRCSYEDECLGFVYDGPAADDDQHHECLYFKQRDTAFLFPPDWTAAREQCCAAWRHCARLQARPLLLLHDARRPGLHVRGGVGRRMLCGLCRGLQQPVQLVWLPVHA